MKGLKSTFLTVVLLPLTLSLQTMVAAQQIGNSSAVSLKPIDVIRLLISGRTISSEQADTLEKALAADSNNVAARVNLIAYYSRRHDEPSKSKKNEQALWFIRNMPDAEMLHPINHVRLNPLLDKRFDEAKQLWLANLDEYKDNLAVIANAVDFFMNTDTPLAEKLIRQAVAAEPANPKWRSELGHLLTLEMTRATGETRRGLAAKAYEQYALAYPATNNDEEKAILLVRLPVTAFEAGDFKNARAWAVEVLNQAVTKQSWTLADPVHHAHIVIGRIALINGDVAEAKQRLVQAGQTKGSPVLNSFGPNMTLAKELLENGERDAVIKYFELCANFWKDQGKLQQWTARVRAGEIPEFGGNLVY